MNPSPKKNETSTYLENLFRERLPLIMPEFELRESQLELSKKIQGAIQDSSTLSAEAGTGVGKSLAYLIPSALYALENESTVVISTETKALQNQLLTKDIPLLRKLLDREITAEIAMGAGNYLCIRKFKNLENQGTMDVDILHQWDKILHWTATTATGNRTDYPGFVPNDFWSKVNRESDNCLGKACPNYSYSFYFLAKEKWRKANILIVNHSLLASHIAGGFRLLPEFDRLIIDEAHNFAEIMGSSFRVELQYESVQKLLNYIHSKDSKTCLASQIHHPKELIDQVELAKTDIQNIFGRLPEELPFPLFGVERLTRVLKLDGGKFEKTANHIIEKLTEKQKHYTKESDLPEEREVAQGLEMSIGRLQAIVDFLWEVRNRKEPNLVFWCEPPNSKKGERFVRIVSEPLNVDEIITENLVPKMKTIVFTSATLTTAKKDFGYFHRQVGFPTKASEQYPSPFDYSRQAILFLPTGIRDPNTQAAGYQEDITERIRFLVELTRGDCFVLFTSNKSLNHVRLALESKLSYPIFSQTVMGADMAKKSFLENKNSVLFGVNSFWQGIDVKGDRLVNVIITKLPFQAPTEPVLQTKIEILKKNNRDPFREFQLPRAGILLKQGFGRLIRSGSDYGIVSILDPRIHTKSYGKTLLKVFPESIKTIHHPQELVQNFRNLPKIRA